MASLAKRFKQLVAPKKLTTELAVATEFGPRHATFDPVASGMVPERLAAILREAVDGDPREFLGFAEEMEERDGHYRSVLGTRKRALSGIEPIVTAAGEEAQDTAIAEAVREHLVEVPQFNGLVEDALDGLGKGFAVVEMMWRTDVTPWHPVEYVWRDPRFFQFDRVTRREIRLREQGSNEGVELAPYKYVVHVPRLKSGLPIRGGLARLAAWSFMIKSFAVKDWAAFAEGYGMPIRVGRYGPNATEDDKRTLLRALRQIAADMAVAIPQSMEIELVERQGKGGDPVFAGLAEYSDKQMSKGILGQTMTTDDGSSQAQANVHDNVRFDILKADARQLEATINRDLVIPFIDLNFGPQEIYPRIEFPVIEPEDLVALSDVVTKLVSVGVQLGETDVRERFGFKEPGDDDDILGQVGAVADTQTEKATTLARQPCPSCGVVHGRDGGADDDLDMIAAESLADWTPQMAPIIDPIREAVAKASSLAELEAALDRIASQTDAGPLARTLAKLTAKARGLGDTGNA